MNNRPATNITRSRREREAGAARRSPLVPGFCRLLPPDIAEQTFAAFGADDDPLKSFVPRLDEHNIVISISSGSH